MPSISPREAAQIRGKEPIFAIAFVIIVGIVCYLVLSTIPSYIRQIEQENANIQKEIQEREKSKALERYQQKYDSLYSTFENTLNSLSTPTTPTAMDDVRRLVKAHNLELLDLSRSTKSGGNVVSLAKNLEVNVIEINLVTSGNVNDAISFMNDFVAQGVYRRITQLTVSTPGATDLPKYTMTLVLAAH